MSNLLLLCLFLLLNKNTNTFGGISMEAKKSFFDKIFTVEKVPVQVNHSEEKLDMPIDEAKPSTPESKPSSTYEIREEVKSDKLLSIQGVYNKFNLVAEGTNTIFIIDNFFKALPDYLPEDVKRQSVLNIISSSGMNIEGLLKDGSERLSVLKSYGQNFSENTERVVAEYENEIRILTEKISSYKSFIADRKKLQEEQTATLEYETQKIQNIIHFINPLK